MQIPYYFLYAINWLLIVIPSHNAWNAINDTVFSPVAWVAFFLPLAAALFLLRPSTHQYKALRWILVFFFGLEAALLLAKSHDFAVLPLVFVIAQLLRAKPQGDAWQVCETTGGKLVLTLIAGAKSIIFIVLVFYGVFGMLNYSGFCFETFRFLSDEQKIRIAVADRLKAEPPNQQNQQNQHEATVSYHYQDVDDFLRLNAECCQVSGADFFSGVPLEWLERLCGRLSDYVYVWEPSKYKDKNMMPDNSVHIVALTNCGKAWSDFY
jgi:hypothetical protein